MPVATVRPVTLPHAKLLLDWAAEEGWNPGLDDARLFYQVDPDGFFMAFDGQFPVAGISVVRHDEDHGFLGLYICHPDYRGRGHGWAVWQAGMGHLADKVIGLDGVIEQQDNYRKSGFELAYRNIRYAGSSAELSGDKAAASSGITCRAITAADLALLHAMDKQVHGCSRCTLLDSWLTDTDTRISLMAESQGRVQAFGTIRACVKGFKIGPLIANTPEQALALLSQLIARASASEIVLDVPEPNAKAIRLAEAIGLEPVFETARMFKGPAPPYQLDCLYGVTSFELG